MTSLIAAAVLGQGTPTIRSLVQDDLRDLSFTARVASSNQAELRKINPDFANSYRFSSSQVWLKEPFKLRLESTVDDTKIFFILNGSQRTVRVPRAGISQREDLSKAPGKRQTPLDFGLLTPSLFQDYFVAKFVRTETRGEFQGDHVFDLTYVARLDDTTRHRVWVDPTTKITAKREWYSQLGGHLMAVFTYDQVREVSGVWIPTRLTVRNADGKVAGATTYAGVKVNSGLADSLFEAR